MKRSSLALVLVAAAGLFLSSCSTFKNMGIEKRRYNKGFYVHVRDQKKTTDAVAATQTSASAQQDAVASLANTTPLVRASNNANATAAPVQAAPAATSRNNWSAHHNKPANSARPLENRFKHALLKHEMKKHAFTNTSAKSRGGDINVAVLVIIAILIPPLAVYLSEGELNSKFWLDLLLTLLFYVPGLIYALIVIL